MKSEIFRTAWHFFKTGIFNDFAQALKAAWMKFKILSGLKSGIVYFRFTKQDGQERRAIGTLNPSNFKYEPTGTGRAKTPEVITFWDVENRGFRSFKIDNLISIE